MSLHHKVYRLISLNFFSYVFLSTMVLITLSGSLVSCRSISHKQTPIPSSNTEMYSMGREEALIKNRERLFYFIALKGVGHSLTNKEISLISDIILKKMPSYLPRTSCYVVDHRHFKAPLLTDQELQDGTGLDAETLQKTLKESLDPWGGLLRKAPRKPSDEKTTGWYYSFTSLDGVFCRLSVLMDIKKEALDEAGLSKKIYYLFYPHI